MNKGILKKSQLSLISSACQVTTKHHVLTTIYGDRVYPGDRVGFYIDGDPFERNGTVETLKGLRVTVFNTISNKWEYYDIEESK